MFLISMFLIRLMILEEYESKPCHRVQKLAAHVSSRLSNVWENYKYLLELIWCSFKKLHRWMIKSYLKNSGPHSQLVALDMQCLVTTDIKDTEMDYISMDNDNQRDPCEYGYMAWLIEKHRLNSSPNQNNKTKTRLLFPPSKFWQYLKRAIL